MINELGTFLVIGVIITFGIYFTIKTNFIQVREFKRGWIKMFRHNDSKTGLSSFSASVLAIGGRIGTGNIAGVAFAIYLCGYGVLFWLWVGAFLGMALSFIENTLAQVYKEYDEDGNFLSGPMVYIERGLDKKYHFLGSIYGVLIAFTIGFMYIVLHTSIMAESVLAFTGVNQNIKLELFVVMLIAIVAGYILYGGTKKVARVSTYILPVVLLSFFWLVFLIAIFNLDFIPQFFKLVVENALHSTGVLDGGVWTLIVVAISLSTLSSEAGLGTSTLASGIANGSHPTQQGFASMITIFIDILVCTLTAFVIMLALNGNSIFIDINNTSELAMQSFSYAYEGGGVLLLMFVLVFTFTTLITSISYGLQVIKLLMLDSSYQKYRRFTRTYLISTIVLILLTPFIGLDNTFFTSVVAFASILLLAINLFVMIKLRHVAFDAYNHYRRVGHEFKASEINLEYKDGKNDIWI